MSSTIQNYIKQFLDSLINHSSGETIKNYSFYLQRFASITKVSTAEEITKEKIETFRSRLTDTRNQRGALLSRTTINYHLIALRAFLEFLKLQSVASIRSSAVRLEKIKNKKRDGLTKKDIEKLMAAPLDKNKSRLIGTRDRALLELLLSTGLKVSEISHLTRSEFEKHHSVIAIRGLRKATRTVTPSHHAWHWIKQYLSLRNDTAPALFVRHDKAQKKDTAALTPRSIQRILTKYSASSGLPPHTTPETLRQEYARGLAEAGYETKKIKESLGHASAVTTRRYTKN